MKRSRLHRNNRISIITAVLLFAVQLFAASLCFADDFSINGVRDESLFIRIPSTWTAEESGSLDEDADMIEAGAPTYKVLELKGGDGARQGELWIYAEPSTYERYYCDTQEEAEEYYDESGFFAVSSIIETAFPDISEWDCEADFIKGEDDFTYVVRLKTNIERKPYMIYLVCDYASGGAVHEALLFEGNGDLDTRDRIAESIEGYGYATELIGNREYSTTGGSDYSQYGDIEDNSIDIEKLFGSFIWIIIWIVIVAFVVKKLKSVYSKKGTESVRDSFRQKQPVRDRSARKSIDKWVFRESKSERPDHQEHDDCLVQGGSRYTGYRESLKTLHKSGLLTTKEMNELLEKHKDDI